MTEREIHISSVNRVKVGKSKAEDFVIKFNPILKLANNMKHDLAVDRLSMTYSWYNINPEYKNNVIKCITDSGNSWESVIFVDEMYSYSDINDYLHQYMDQKKKHKTAEGNYYINILFVLSSYKVVIEIDNNYQLELRNSNFGELIGFEQKLVSQTEYGSKLPTITNSIDIIHINTDAITDSIVNGKQFKYNCYHTYRQSHKKLPFFI